MSMFRQKSTSPLILHPDIEMAWNHLGNLHSEFVQNGQAANCQLLGVSGCGKSTLLKNYACMHAEHRDEYGVKKPTIYFAMPSAPTPRSIMAAIVGAFGGADVGTANSLMNRAVHYIKHFRVEVLLADETHHLIDRGRMRTHAHLGDLWKEFNDQVECCLVLAGAPRLVQLLETNNQLRNRAGANLVLRPFAFDNFEEPLAQFVLAAIQGTSLERHSGFLRAEETLTRIQFATDGVPAHVVRFLRNLAAAGGQMDQINFVCMSKAWQMPGSAGFPPERRPFDQKFCFERLIGLGEPFYPSPFDGDNHAPYF